jgi:outer membrane protein insertion porin family
MKWLLLILMLAAAPGFAQKRPARPAAKKAPAPAEAPTKFPVESLRVEGNSSYTAAQVLAVAGIKVGQLAGKEEFEAARLRLEASGAFDTAGFRFAPAESGKGYAAVFQVTEFLPVLPVKFHELGVPDAALAAALRAADPLFTAGKLPASKISVDRATGALQKLLRSKGLDDKIAGLVAPWPFELSIVFRSTKNLASVAEVAFEGSQVIPESALREAIAGVAVGSLYTEEAFRALLDSSVRPVYEARGRLRVAFPKVSFGPSEGVDGVRVVVTVVEGESYKLGAVRIADASPVKPEELLKAGAFQTGAVANFDRINEGLENIHKALRRAGYMDATATLERDIHDAEKTVDLAVRLKPGAQYLMGKLKVTGLDLTAEAEILRMWALKEGKPFNPDYPETFLSRIREQGVFDNLGDTKSEVKTNAAAHTVDVTLKFGGAAPKPDPANRRIPN